MNKHTSRVILKSAKHAAARAGAQRESKGLALVLMKLKETDGSPSWAYVALAENRIIDFMLHAGQPIDIEQLGKVLLRGEGEEPPAEAREYIFDLYGFDS
jgi:hypothetical protein